MWQQTQVKAEEIEAMAKKGKQQLSAEWRVGFL